ncbi:MAG: hypothetical protein JSU98_03225 [Gemmatimonadales bacterium]|jgi:hypothetical protein|nr:MAG: hypothetical protein JSU98_03225 [Gemmatimonadales bacterium]
MRQLIRETLHQASHESPAIPFVTLVERLRSQGAAVTDEILARILSEPGSGARIVDPWLGLQHALRSYLGDDRSRPGPWVILDPDDGEDPPDPHTPAPVQLRRALIELGRHLDVRSSRDVARWIGLVEEASRLPRAA